MDLRKTLAHETEFIPDDDYPHLPQDAVLPEDEGEGACQWLDDYVEFSQRWSPRSYGGYHEACAIWTLSTIAARRVKTEFGGQKYTPLYILLSGRTSYFAKTSAANIAIATLKAAGLEYMLAPDQCTPQKYLSLLASRLPDNYDESLATHKDLIKKRLGLAGARGWFHEEFGSHISAMMQQNGFMADFRGLLRKFDDCPESYENSTIGRGDELIERPYLALLANITPADLNKFAKKGSTLWGDGFLARFAIVCPNKGDETSTRRYPTGIRIIPENLWQPLKQWDIRLGHATVTISPPPLKSKTNKSGNNGNDSDSEYEDVINGNNRLQIDLGPIQTIPLSNEVFECEYRYLDALGALARTSDKPDLDGNYIRFAEKALRIAILLASLNQSPTVEISHWARAQSITERWRRGLHNLFETVNGENTRARDLEDRLIAVLHRHNWCTPGEAGRWLHISSNEAKTILDNLVQAGECEVRDGDRTKRYGFSIAKELADES